MVTWIELITVLGQDKLSRGATDSTRQLMRHWRFILVCKSDWQMAGKLSECKSVDFVDGGVTEGCLNAAPFRGQWSWLSRSRLRESVRSVLKDYAA